MPYDDHYAVLGVRRGSSVNEIRKAYRQLVLRYHPDRNPGDEAAVEKFRQVTEAYEVLGDETKRARYDETLGAFEQAAAASFAEAERKRREAAAARREARAERVGTEGAAWRRTSGRASYRFEANDLQGDDVANGIALGAATWVFLVAHTFRHDDALPLWLASLLSLVPLVAGHFAYRAGQPVSRLMESLCAVLDAPFWLESSAKAVPAMAAVAGAAAVLAVFPSLGVFSWWCLPGMVAAGIAGAIGSGFGRAFTSVARRRSSKLIGVGVGAVAGGLVGLVLGLLFISVGSANVVDNSVFDRMLGAASGASLGGALASVLGSLREPG